MVLAGKGRTTTGTVVDAGPAVATTVVAPETPAVTTPPGVTDATAAFKEVNVTATPVIWLPEPSSTVATSWIVCPDRRVTESGTTRIVAGTGTDVELAEQADATTARSTTRMNRDSMT